ncbi:SDR family NAD(P)-dependent oxidoreductase [Corynebacterium casei]
MVEGQAVFITGAGSGLGKALAMRFAQEGARVSILDINKERVTEAAEEINNSVGDDRVLPLTADVRNPDSLHQAVDAHLEQFGSIDTVIPNAGIWDYNRSITRMGGEEIAALFDEIMSINVKGYLLTVEATWRELLKSRGSVVMTLSNAAYYAAGGGVSYTASKFAARGMVIQLAYELAPKVRVNGVAVGGMRTNLSGPVAGGLQERKFSDVMDKRPEGGNPYIPLHDVSTQPETFTGPYVMLASKSDGANITGHIVNIDGGIAARGFANSAGGDSL